MSNRIYIIGMGPGREEMMTGEAIAALEQADVIVGYTVYVKLLGERFAGKKLLTTPMHVPLLHFRSSSLLQYFLL